MAISSDWQSPQDVKIGDTIFLFVNGRGGHGAYITVERMTAKTFFGTEAKKSYQPGTPWKVSKNAAFAIVFFVDGIHPETGENAKFMRIKWFNI